MVSPACCSDRASPASANADNGAVVASWCARSYARAASRGRCAASRPDASVESSAHGLANSLRLGGDPVGEITRERRVQQRIGHPVRTEHERVRHEGVTLAQHTRQPPHSVEAGRIAIRHARSHRDRRRVGERGGRRPRERALHLVGDARLLQASGRYAQRLHGLVLANRRQRAEREHDERRPDHGAQVEEDRAP